MADADYAAVLSLPCAAAGIRVRGDAISEICFLPAGTPARPAATRVAADACERIQAYLNRVLLNPLLPGPGHLSVKDDDGSHGISLDDHPLDLPGIADRAPVGIGEHILIVN
jgi:hypothetical protein